MCRVIIQVTLWVGLLTVSLAVYHETQAQTAFYRPVNQLDAAVQTAFSFEIASLRLEAEAWSTDARILRKNAGISSAAAALSGLSTAFNPNLADLNAATAQANHAQAASGTFSAVQMEGKAEEIRMLWAKTRTSAMILRGITACEDLVSTFWLLSAESDRMAMEAQAKSGAGRKKRHRKAWWKKVAVMRDNTTGYCQKAATLCGG